MDQTNQWKKTAASPSTDDDNDALGKWLSENWSAPRPVRNEWAAKFSKSSEMAAFASS